MPRGDKTGPEGMGPMTGRGAGPCADSTAPGSMNPGVGRGMALRRGQRGGGGGGFGRGRGQGVQFPSTMAAPEAFVQNSPQPAQESPQPVQESINVDSAVDLNSLRSQAEDLASSLTAMKERIEELEKQSIDQKAE